MEQQLDEVIRLADLPKYTGLKRTQIQFYIDKGNFPPPIRLGERAKGWLASEVRAWQRERIAARNQRAGG